ncbi:MAG: sigma-54-dependent Fis family transcriptional regulator [Deltaproteobacteria bacterium]|nr:sigma-54-dependent Fis family transcriptional regulator [Deltaproteobacteria bacterium]
MQTILIVDDDKSIRYSLKRMLEENFSVLTAQNGDEALSWLKESLPDLIIMDIKMPGRSGIEVLKEIKLVDPKSLVILMTAYGTTETAIEAMKYGAFDYILKPFPIPQMKELVQKAITLRKLMKDGVSYAFEPDQQKEEEQIIGSSPRMQEIYKVIGQVAPSDVTVLLRGESGTGKELMARAIYQHSLRSEQLFLPVNCAAIPDTLLESELFGHEKGAFTGASSRRIGKLEQCHGGTIFLDEIGDMSLSTQAKLLRVLQEKNFERLGGRETIRVDIRLIVATNKDLEEAIAKGEFREDLYYRLNVVSIKIPPLRERKEDIPALVSYFLRKFNHELKKRVVGITPGAMGKISSYGWPGNVRQLENVLKRAMLLCQGEWILDDQLLLEVEERRESGEVRDRRTFEKLVDSLFEELTGNPLAQESLDMVSAIEKGLIIRALQKTNGNQVQTASLLGINRSTLRGKMDRYHIKKEVLVSEED